MVFLFAERENIPGQGVISLPWALALVKCAAVWMPMLTHTQASHTDALKTHSLQTFLPQDWEVKGGQQFFGTSISRKKIDTGEVSALRGGFPGPEGPFSVLQ